MPLGPAPKPCHGRTSPAHARCPHLKDSSFWLAFRFVALVWNYVGKHSVALQRTTTLSVKSKLDDVTVCRCSTLQTVTRSGSNSQSVNKLVVT